MKLLPVRQKCQTSVFRHSSASVDIQTQSLVCHGANSSLSSLLLCQRTALSLTWLHSEGFEYLSRKNLFQVKHKRKFPAEHLRQCRTEWDNLVAFFFFFLHIFRCSNTTKQAQSAPLLLLAWSAGRSKRSSCKRSRKHPCFFWQRSIKPMRKANISSLCRYTCFLLLIFKGFFTPYHYQIEATPFSQMSVLYKCQHQAIEKHERHGKIVFPQYYLLVVLVTARRQETCL